MFKINGVEWSVREVRASHPRLRNTDNSFSLGSCDNLTHTIYISEGLSDKKFKKVLCHEIVHAAMFSYNIYLEPMEEERVADIIATYGRELIYTTNKIFTEMKKRETLL